MLIMRRNSALALLRSLDAYAALMNQCAELLVKRLHAAAGSGTVDIWALLGDMTLHVIGTAAFGCGIICPNLIFMLLHRTATTHLQICRPILSVPLPLFLFP